MTRIQVRITDGQSKALNEIACAEGVPIAELIRRSIDQYVQLRGLKQANTSPDHWRSVIGKYASNSNDVSQFHDAYLSETYGMVDE